MCVSSTLRVLITFLKIHVPLPVSCFCTNIVNIFIDLFGNPLAQEYDYRSYVVHHLPSVELLDRKGVQ